MGVEQEETVALVPCPECGEDLNDYGLVIISRATTIQDKHINIDHMEGAYDSYETEIHGTVEVLCGFCQGRIPNEYEHYNFSSIEYGQAPPISQVVALRASEV